MSEYLTDEQVAAAASLLDRGIAALAREVQANRKLLAAINALHYHYLGGNGQHHCIADGREWPCPTRRILHPEEVTE